MLAAQQLAYEQGFLDEVRALYQRGDLHADLPALRAVGYRQLWRHLAGECDLDEAVQSAVAATRQLAKRQLTWLRKWPDLGWIYTDREGNVVQRSWSDQTVTGPPGPLSTPLAAALNYLGQTPI